MHILHLVIHAVTCCNEKCLHESGTIGQINFERVNTHNYCTWCIFHCNFKDYGWIAFWEDVAAGSILGACGAALIVVCPLILPTTPLGGNKELEKKNMIYIWGIEMQTQEIA